MLAVTTMALDHHQWLRGALITDISTITTAEEGPLTETDPPLQAGTIIKKIDNQTITPGMDVSLLLNFKADKTTALSIFDPAADARFVVTLKPNALW
jgi:C-terminal processing protease CtpA/Prc